MHLPLFVRVLACQLVNRTIHTNTDNSFFLQFLEHLVQQDDTWAMMTARMKKVTIKQTSR